MRIKTVRTFTTFGPYTDNDDDIDDDYEGDYDWDKLRP